MAVPKKLVLPKRRLAVAVLTWKGNDRPKPTLHGLLLCGVITGQLDMYEC